MPLLARQRLDRLAGQVERALVVFGAQAPACAAADQRLLDRRARSRARARPAPRRPPAPRASPAASGRAAPSPARPAARSAACAGPRPRQKHHAHRQIVDRVVDAAAAPARGRRTRAGSGVSTPAPSPLLPSAPTPPRCAMLPTAVSAMRQDIVARRTREPGDKADAAGIVLEARVVQAAPLHLREILHVRHPSYSDQAIATRPFAQDRLARSPAKGRGQRVEEQAGLSSAWRAERGVAADEPRRDVSIAESEARFGRRRSCVSAIARGSDQSHFGAVGKPE